MIRFWALALLGAVSTLMAQKPENVLLVVNDRSSVSRVAGEYYSRKRTIPEQNICRIKVSDAEEVNRETYDSSIATPISKCLKSKNLVEQVLYMVTTLGVPLRISGVLGRDGEMAAVDSELTLLYAELHGQPHALKGPLANPFFDHAKEPFSHPRFPMYLVTRLAGYDFADIKGLVDRAQQARNTGNFVIDMKNGSDEPGEDWLRDAAVKLPQAREIVDSTTTVLYDLKNVIGYAAWGSNDSNRHRRQLGFKWLPGAIMTEYVSTNARTFARPPEKWTIGTWKDKATWFAGAPQTMTADYIHEGVTGASGHVAEPFLQFCPRPSILLPAYYSGRTLAESYYLSIPAVSWQNIVIGDPLCSLGKPTQ